MLSPAAFNSGLLNHTFLYPVYVFLSSVCLLCPKINTYLNQLDVFIILLLRNFKDI